MKTRPVIVPTGKKSPFEALWCEFPQIENSTLVFRSDIGGSVVRTFRLVDGSYVVITSTKEGNVLQPVDPEEAEIFEAAWKELGQCALEGQPHNPTGIMHTSRQYTELVRTKMFR
jgi:hypothetical protein